MLADADDGLTKIDTTFDGDTVWLSIDQMAELFQRDRSVIGKHVRNIFKEGELQKESVWAKFAYTAADGKVYDVDYYNLDVIISVGYRVKSKRGTQFRIWATGILAVLSSLLMAFAPGLFLICAAMGLNALSSTMFSGTDAALTYDSLKQAGQEERYLSVAANRSQIGMLASALGSLASTLRRFLRFSGFYLVSALFSSISTLAMLLLKEPVVTEAQAARSSHSLRELPGQFAQLVRDSAAALRGCPLAAKLIAADAVISVPCYLTKMFLNEKVTSDTEGVSFYKRTQSIPVKDGDVIYIGCGEKAWPSMNKQGAEARKYTGTWYALRVVDVNKGASTVESMIDELPDASGVKYGNYQLYVNAVAAARASFDALNSKQQKSVDAKKLEKLEKLEDAIKGFRAIDDVRAQIDALPDADRLTTAEREAAKSAQRAYNALTAEQRDYLTGAQLEKITAIAAALTAMDAKHSSGSGSAYTGGHTFTTGLGPGSITGVFVDGKKLDSRYYTVSGSDVTLTADYLKTLRSGKHTVKIENATKVATGSFTLSGSGAVQSSRTGDPGVAIYFAMGAVSFLGSAAWLRKRKET